MKVIHMLFLLGGLAVTYAQDSLKIKALDEIYGFSVLVTPVGREERYELKNAVLGAHAYPQKNLEVVFEYDLYNSTAKNIYIEFHAIRDRKQKLSFVAGQFQSPVTQLLPPKTYVLSRLPIILDKFTILEKGIGVKYDLKGFDVRMAHFGNGGIAGMIQKDNGILFWEKDVGWGVLVSEKYGTSRYLNYSLGFSMDKPDGPKQFRLFIQNHIKLFDRLRVYYRFEEEKIQGFPKKRHHMISAVYTYASNSFVRLLYDTKFNTTVLEIKYFFKIKV